jgi:hypothetical protein
MTQICKMFIAYLAMFIAPFYGDIFSTAAQMTVKTVIPIITG